MNIILRSENVSKVYGGNGNETQALREVDLSVEEGSFTAIIGKSGSGKSTLLRILGGLDKPTEGNVFLREKNLYQLSSDEITRLRRRKIGFIFQHFNLFPEFTVEENIKMPLFFDNKEPDLIHIDAVMEMLSLHPHAKKLPQQLSGGEQQRTAIARAFAVKPDIIFADEPTGNLDSVTSQEVLELFLLSQRVFGQTMLLVTHDLELVEPANRVLTLQDGALICDRRSVV